MKPIKMILSTFFHLLCLYLFSSEKNLAKASEKHHHTEPLYHSIKPSYGCNNTEITAHLIFLEHNNKAIFRTQLSQQIAAHQCQHILPNQHWQKKNRYYNMTALHPALWKNRDINPEAEIFVPTANFIPIPPPLKGYSLPPDLPFLFSGFYWLYHLLWRIYRRRAAWRLITTHIAQQRETLIQRRLHLVMPDSYGTIHYDKWHKEITLFCRSYLLPKLKNARLQQFWPSLEGRSKQIIDEWTKLSEPTTKDVSPPLSPSKEKATSSTNVTSQTALHLTANMNPLDYERFCAQLLEQAGWLTHLTSASGDQGTDIIAIRNGVRLVVQCKLYNRPVGNRAVQEIFSAKKHQQAHIAIVVSNARYTRQAHQLAASTGVHLLHHRQLATLDEKNLPRNSTSF